MRAVLLPVGPGEIEIRRLASTIASLNKFEDAERISLFLIDDSPEPRDLESHIEWSSPVTSLRTSAWKVDLPAPKPFDAMVAGSILGLRSARDAGATSVLKLDTDAMVIAPVFPLIEQAFDSESRLGIVGSCLRDCVGYRRPYKFWTKKLRAVRHSRDPDDRALAKTLWKASLQPGYRLGRHCLGGAYAVGNGALQSDIWDSSLGWDQLDISEDVIVSALVAATGHRWKDLTAPGQPFALAWQGLPQTPEWIVEHDYGVVHSVKKETWAAEAELRASLTSLSANRMST